MLEASREASPNKGLKSNLVVMLNVTLALLSEQRRYPSCQRFDNIHTINHRWFMFLETRLTCASPAFRNYFSLSPSSLAGMNSVQSFPQSNNHSDLHLQVVFDVFFERVVHLVHVINLHAQFIH
jgi:hypothetical protein